MTLDNQRILAIQLQPLKLFIKLPGSAQVKTPSSNLVMQQLCSPNTGNSIDQPKYHSPAPGLQNV
ncbi:MULTISPECIES: hypothetical protein [unclassified Halomonas]|uniref:hypothetical protein n=1 Tax=unclassified Halomonas TaxID=2609666 RepID=UPI0012ED2D96|nr:MULTISPECIES: hypothetical protein [unclassified Halomonas]MCO7214986.1 hypothetical protein [Halomonas sp. OfavH-34-E]